MGRLLPERRDCFPSPSSLDPLFQPQRNEHQRGLPCCKVQWRNWDGLRGLLRGWRSLRTNECAHRSLDQVRRCQWNPRLLRKAVASQSRRHVRCAKRFLFLLSFTLVESITYFDSKEGYDQLVHSSDVVFICAYVILL